MSNDNWKIILEDTPNDFLYKKNKSNLDIRFSRVAFIFFVFFLIAIIYCIHLIHLGSRKVNIASNTTTKYLSDKIYRADILDRNGNYLSKTVSSIDIGISPSKVINEKKLILNLKYIFPNKDYLNFQKKLKKGKFFYFEKKISDENYDKLMQLGDKSIESRNSLTRIYPQKNLFSHVIG